MYPDVSLHINGEWVKGSEGRSESILNPATGEKIGTLSHATKPDLDKALAAADAGFKVWKKTPADTRYKTLRKAADIIRSRADDIAKIMVMEQGKPLMEAKGETLLAGDIMDWFAEEARRTYGRVIPARGENIYQLVIKEPVGPVAAFTPWNFPINQAVRKVSAAIAAGCSIILKGPEDTPASCAELVKCYIDAGVPQGVLQLVYGNPAEISSYLIPHPVIRKVTFTGSTPVGKQLASLAGLHMKRITMELGGHAPAIVFEDANVDQAVKVLFANKHRNAGQVCVAPTRFLVHEKGLWRFRAEIHGLGEEAEGRRRSRQGYAHGSAGRSASRRCDGSDRFRRRRQGRKDRDRRQAHRQQGQLLRADRAHQHQSRHEDHA
jgi:succinate-semialdehyde dehydrogenase/glutarate-semialdehyde dehydrogenase